MSKYAKINSNNIVENIIVCEDSSISLLEGVYIKVTESTNIPVIGLNFNFEKNKFSQLKPFESWIEQEDLTWQSPKGPKPDGIFTWDEDSQEWINLS